MPDHNRTALTLIELLSSRICHDLVSPVGAIHNGVEFMEEMGADSSDEALSLIAHSAATAGARLMVFRMAYGAGGRDASIKPRDVYDAFQKLLNIDNKVSQAWTPESLFDPMTDRPDAFAKILTACLLLLLENLPKGGSISVLPAGTDPLVFDIRATGVDANFRAGTAAALSNETSIDTLDPRMIHPFIVGLMATVYGYRIEIAATEANTIGLRLTVGP